MFLSRWIYPQATCWPGDAGLSRLFSACSKSTALKMPPGLKSFLQSWLINTLAVLVATGIVKGIHCADWLNLVAATLTLGILNAILRPLLLLLSLPLVILTLGLFTLVINAVLLYLVSWLIPAFQVDSFGYAFLGALVISLVSLVLNSLTGTGRTRFQVRRSKRPPDRDDDGPVIDV
jgi:putative membrane protein